MKTSVDQRYGKEADTLNRLIAANRAEQKAINAGLLSAVRTASSELDLSPELYGLLGRKAQALPDVLVALYLRETVAYSRSDLQAHLEKKCDARTAQYYIRLMGVAHLGAEAVLPRPRIFPRAMLVTDIGKIADLGDATIHRSFQLLSKAKLITESEGGPNGALDLLVNRSLLSLVEDAVAAVPRVDALNHPFGIPALSTRGAVLALALTAGLMIWPSSSQAEFNMASDQALVGFPTLAPGDMVGQQPFVCAATRPEMIGMDCGDVLQADLRDVLEDGRKLFGPHPRPAPVDPLQMVSLRALVPGGETLFVFADGL